MEGLEQVIPETTETPVVEKPGSVNDMWTTGRRKTSVARVKFIKNGSGKLTINGKTLDAFFGGLFEQKSKVNQPLNFFSDKGIFDIAVNVAGGGITGQADAISHGISRALSRMHPELRPKLKAEGLLRRDPRMVERKKSGQPKARKKFQWTKR